MGTGHPIVMDISLPMWMESHRTTHGVVVDVRSEAEINSTPFASDLRISVSEINQIHNHVPSRLNPILFVCASGVRSRKAAEEARKLGFLNSFSLTGGVNGLSSDERYSRHRSLPEVGAKGQERISKARVLIVGLGGLGSPAAYYLSAAGVGCLGLVDHDVVELSNLQRQILYSSSRVGLKKLDSALETLRAFNPTIQYEGYPVRLDETNVQNLIGSYDIVVDGTDNFAARFCLNDACVRAGIPLIHGSVSRFEGQVMVIVPGGPCYRCVFPEPPPSGVVPSCAEAGVLGVLPGIVGSLQAVECLKLILDRQDVRKGELISYRALEQTMHRLTVSRRPGCLCHPNTELLG